MVRMTQIAKKYNKGYLMIRYSQLRGASGSGGLRALARTFDGSGPPWLYVLNHSPPVKMVFLRIYVGRLVHTSTLSGSSTRGISDKCKKS